MATPEQRQITPHAGSHDELGRLLGMMEDTRARTLAVVAGIDQDALDWTAPGVENTTGSLLYHIALIEADYLYADILGVDYPEWLDAVFPWPDREESGRLSVVVGLPLDDHLARLKRVRDDFLVLVAPLTADQLAASRFLPDANYAITPAWVLHHLMQHEAEHRGQIMAVLTFLRTGSPAPARRSANT